MKTVIITGGAGFIGCNLCKKLLTNDEIRIICIDNLSSGSIDNILEFVEHPNFTFCYQDIVSINYTMLLDQMNIQEIHQIFHLACMASPVHYQKNPLETLDVCFTGTKKILELAVKYNCRILFTSTSEVYGNPLVSVQNEEYFGNVNPIGIRACYDEGKRVAETLCFEYKRNHFANVCVIRIFNTYGPYMSKNDGRVIPNFINQCLEDKGITIYGNGEQTRSFCFIDDLLNGMIKMIESTETGPINIGNPEVYSIAQLAERIKIITKSKSNIVYEDLPSDDPSIREPCIEKACILLDWTPTVNLSIGLRKTIEFEIKRKNDSK
jgi:UDP-glucuronate decarboxylase